MIQSAYHSELHRTDRIGWLRAAVLGANDGILSVASILVGVAAASNDRHAILLAGVAGLVAGAMSMAAGEYVSASSQSDTENADRIREAQELRDDPEAELAELTQIYIDRGLDKTLAEQVARQLTEKDVLTTHMRDELGISEHLAARPIQAASPVVATENDNKIIGVLRRKETIALYNQQRLELQKQKDAENN